jgi:hypothetical protein
MASTIHDRALTDSRRRTSGLRAPIVDFGRNNARKFVANALLAAIGFALTLAAIGNGLFLFFGQN